MIISFYIDIVPVCPVVSTYVCVLSQLAAADEADDNDIRIIRKMIMHRKSCYPLPEEVFHLSGCVLFLARASCRRVSSQPTSAVNWSRLISCVRRACMSCERTWVVRLFCSRSPLLFLSSWPQHKRIKKRRRKEERKKERENIFPGVRNRLLFTASYSSSSSPPPASPQLRVDA